MHVSALITQYGFICVAFIIFTGEIGLPILVPGEIALFVAGSQLIHSLSALLVACLLFGAVDLIASGVLHMIARGGGSRLLSMVLRRVLKDRKQPERVLSGWRDRLSSHDALVIFVVRSVPGIRISASVISGLLRLRVDHVLLGAAPASLLWTGIPLILGYEMRRQFGSLATPDPRLALAFLVCVAVLFVLGGARWWIVRQRDGEHRHGRDAERTAA